VVQHLLPVVATEIGRHENESERYGRLCTKESVQSVLAIFFVGAKIFLCRTTRKCTISIADGQNDLEPGMSKVQYFVPVRDCRTGDQDFQNFGRVSVCRHC
jgi:hypothetical protein